jgi:transposase
MALRGQLSFLKAHDGTIRCRAIGWLTRPAVTGEKKDTLYLHTGNGSLLVAVDEHGRRLWVENGDHLPHLIVGYQRRLKRLSEDSNAEKHPTANFQRRRDELVRKQHNRLQSTINEVAAHLASFAARKKFARVVYNDSDRWLNEFPYFRLEERIRTNLDESGIEFVKIDTSAAARDVEQQPLEQE